MPHIYCFVGPWKKSLFEKFIASELNVTFVIPGSEKFLEKYADFRLYMESSGAEFLLYRGGELVCPVTDVRQEIACNSVLYSSGFPLILPSGFLSRFSRALNLHPVELPKYRGRYLRPFLLDQPVEGNATLHYIDENVDSGNILREYHYKVGPFDTTKSVIRSCDKAEINNFDEIIRLVTSVTIERGVPQRIPALRPNSERRLAPSDSELPASTSLLDALNFARVLDQNAYPAFFKHLGRQVRVRFESVGKEFEDEI